MKYKKIKSIKKKIKIYKTIDKICGVATLTSAIVMIWAEKGSKLMDYAVNSFGTFGLLSLILLIVWLDLDEIRK